MSVMRVIVLHPIPSLTFPFRTYGRFLVTALVGLVTLTFDLLASKWIHGFMPANFQLATLLRLDLVSGTGQTDRQTDRQTNSGHE